MQKKTLILFLFLASALLVPNVGVAQLGGGPPDIYVEITKTAEATADNPTAARSAAISIAEDQLNQAVSNATPPPDYALKGVLWHTPTGFAYWTGFSEYTGWATASATVVWEYVGPLDPDPLDDF